MTKARALALLLAAAALAAWLFAPVSTHWTSAAPEGPFKAVVRTQPIYALWPVMPGGGSDKPALITVYRAERSCGSTWLEAAQLAYDFRWSVGAAPRTADIPNIARWDLDRCSMVARDERRSRRTPLRLIVAPRAPT